MTAEATMSENHTDPPRDPAFAAVARARAAEKAFTAAALAGNYDANVGLTEARAALAATVATTPAGLAVITGFVREMTRDLEEFYFEDEEAVTFANSLDAAVRRIAGLPPRVA
jgi:hypothetical protein